MVKFSCALTLLSLASIQAFAPSSKAAFLPTQRSSATPRFVLQDPKSEVGTFGVDFQETKHTLYFVDSLENIDNGRPDSSKEVAAYQLSNNKGVKVTAMAEGGNMVQMSLNGEDYIWDNKEGAVYYGKDSNAFPLTRGLILHGGVRFAAVTAEHGLYYDSQWDMSTVGDENERSIILKIADTQENRDKVADPFSQGQFNRGDMNDPSKDHMTKYPVTNLEFTYKITLRKDEDFVRLSMTVENPTDKDANAEAWLPMTFPLKSEDCLLLDEQPLRWRRDEWVFPWMANMVNWDGQNDLFYPLHWPGSGIFYDYPEKKGDFHGVVIDPAAGRGVVYVAPQDQPHYTKMWSWGSKEYFHRPTADDLAKGRPYSEYYEPWSSGFNFGFFQTSEFKAGYRYSWEVAILPIADVLTSNDKESLNGEVQKQIANRMDVGSLSGVQVTHMSKLRP